MLMHYTFDGHNCKHCVSCVFIFDQERHCIGTLIAIFICTIFYIYLLFIKHIGHLVNMHPLGARPFWKTILET